MSEGEENNREVEDDPPDSSSPEGRVKSEGASRGYEFSSEESEAYLPLGAYPADSSPYLLLLPLLLL
jgi:hypothetical protein